MTITPTAVMAPEIAEYDVYDTYCPKRKAPKAICIRPASMTTVAASARLLAYSATTTGHGYSGGWIEGGNASPVAANYRRAEPYRYRAPETGQRSQAGHHAICHGSGQHYHPTGDAAQQIAAEVCWSIIWKAKSHSSQGTKACYHALTHPWDALTRTLTYLFRQV